MKDTEKSELIQAAKLANPLDEMGSSAWWQEVVARIALETSAPKVEIEPRPGREEK